MTAFPLGEPSEKTRIKPDSGKRLMRTQGGDVRGTSQYATTRFQINVVYDLLSSSEVSQVMSHHDNEPDDDHTITIDGQLYNFQYVNRPQVVGYHGLERDVEFEIEAWL